MLRDHLAGQGLQVEFGVEATSIEADGDGVTVSLDKDGRKEVVRADYLIGAGGGHSVTRHSMEEHLDGETYGGRYIVADVRLALPSPPGRARIVVGPSGFVLLSLLPESRYLIFVNRDEADQGDGAAVRRRTRGAAQHPDWSRRRSFRSAMDFVLPMHKRVVPALSDGRRFLLGDAGHLSSPMGGEGINSALMDGAKLRGSSPSSSRGRQAFVARKLRIRARARRPTRAGSLERNPRHGHAARPKCARPGKRCLCRLWLPPRRSQACASARCSTYPTRAGFSPSEGRRRRASARSAVSGLVRSRRDATHHLVFSGGAPRLDDFRARWGALVSVVQWKDADILAKPAGLAQGGMVLVRPDGFIGFRRASADDAAMKSLETHLSTYLQPNFAAAEKVAAHPR